MHHLFSPTSSNQSHNLCHFFSLPCQLFHSGVTEHSEHSEHRTTISRETQRSVPRALIDCRRRASGDERTPVSRRFLAGEITGSSDRHASSSALSTKAKSFTGFNVLAVSLLCKLTLNLQQKCQCFTMSLVALLRNIASTI